MIPENPSGGPVYDPYRWRAAPDERPLSSYRTSATPPLIPPFTKTDAPALFSDNGWPTVDSLLREPKESGERALSAHTAASDPVTAMMQDRHWTDWLAVADTFTQLRDRQAIYDQHVRELEAAKLGVLNHMHRHPKILDEVSPQVYEGIQQRLHELDKEQRTERVSFWRDASRLRQELPESLRAYLGATRRLELLADDEEDHDNATPGGFA